MTSLSQIVPYISLATQFFGVAPLTGGVLPVQRLITITAALTPGATSAQMTADVAATVLKPGTVLSFQGTTRRIAVFVNSPTDITLTTTASAVPIQPLTFAIASSSTSPFWVGTLPVLGLSDFSFEPDPVTEDVTGTDSGGGKVMAKIRTGQKASITVNERPADAGIELVKAAGESAFDVASNLWFVSIRPDGEMRAGVGLINSLSSPGGASNAAKQTFELMIQGTNFTRYKAYV